MSLWRMFMARLRYSLRNLVTLVFVAIAAVISVLAGAQMQDTSVDTLHVAVVMEDKGDYGGKLLKALQTEDALDFVMLSREKALSMLRQDRLEVVYIICADYSEKLLNAEYDNIIEIYSAPSSSAVATLTEPLVSNTMAFWIQEEAITCVRQNQMNMGRPFTAEMEASLRNSFTSIWEEGSSVSIMTTELDANAVEQQIGTGAAAAFVCYFGILSVFYVVVSAKWMLDFQCHSLLVRAQQRGNINLGFVFCAGVCSDNSVSCRLYVCGYFLYTD